MTEAKRDRILEELDEAEECEREKVNQVSRPGRVRLDLASPVVG